MSLFFIVGWIKVYPMIKFLPWIVFDPYVFDSIRVGWIRNDPGYKRGVGGGGIGSLGLGGAWALHPIYL